jgi:cyclophilin family peptidyl-prolyl cis-trans isomerase
MSCVGIAGLVLGLSVAGCGKKAGPAPADAGAAAPADAGAASEASGVRLGQSFAEATLAEPPDDSERPPDSTLTKKSVGKLYTEVVKHWDEVRFVTSAGKKIQYTATIETDVGNITLELWPEVAPNHVRNFITLAKAGYYDGLVFERTVHDGVDDPDMKIERIEAGCPLGTGYSGCGSIGYWLKPEPSDKVTHDEGVLGACHSAEEEASGCRFSINLAKAPFLDGQYTLFGKVTQGLDVARKILSLPVRNDAEYPEGDRPVNPVVMRHVTIKVTEGEAIAAK